MNAESQLQRMFQDASQSAVNGERPGGDSERIVHCAEAEFLGPSQEYLDREREKQKVRGELARMKNLYRKLKPRSASRRALRIAAEHAKKRTEVKKKIALLELRLREIAMEGGK